MEKSNKRSEAIRIALNLEREGIKFYADAADKMTQAFSKRMFLSLVGDEKRHIEIFEELAKKEGVVPSAFASTRKGSPAQRVNALFKELGKQIKRNLKPGDDDVKVIEIAKGMEEKSYNFYTATAKEISDTKEREIFEKIAIEENEHWRILDDTLLYLTNQAEWNLKEERPLIDAG